MTQLEGRESRALEYSAAELGPKANVQDDPNYFVSVLGETFALT
jgi:hypothetical protein